MEVAQQIWGPVRLRAAVRWTMDELPRSGSRGGSPGGRTGAPSAGAGIDADGAGQGVSSHPLRRGRQSRLGGSVSGAGGPRAARGGGGGGGGWADRLALPAGGREAVARAFRSLGALSGLGTGEPGRAPPDPYLADCLVGLDAALPGAGGAGRVCVWYSHRRREATAEVRLL